MQPDEGRWDDATTEEQAILGRIRAHALTVGEPVTQGSRWAVAAFYSSGRSVTVGIGKTRLEALTDLEGSVEEKVSG